MKLLDNVLWDIEGKKAVKWRSENEFFYNLPDNPYPHRLSKLESRPLTTEEKAHYLYDLCCKPHSRLGDYFELDEFMGGRLANLLPETMLHPDESRETFIKQEIRYFLVKPERKTKIIGTSKWEMKP